MIKLANGLVYDSHHRGVVKDIYFAEGKIVSPQHDMPCQTYDVSGKIVMAGAIDLHSHIAGGGVNLARLLLNKTPAALPNTLATGYRYAEMGYTCAFEPAMIPHNARHTHLEMQDIPLLDTGSYVVLGNEDYFLQCVARSASTQELQDYVAWMLRATQSYAVKVVNAGGIDAFKFNQRHLQLDELHPFYPVTPRQILQKLAHTVQALGVAHPLHIHASNLGIAGNVKTTLATLQALEGLPAHLTHLQFHSYGAEGEYGFSSGAEILAEYINQHPEISIDVGQIIFGQTATLSADIAGQYRMQKFATMPQMLCDAHAQAGCGLMPFRYRHHSFVHALQWAIGLELFLRIKNPWQIALSTDHPNGAPFHSYPHIIRLLMDAKFRNQCLEKLPATVQKYSSLNSLTREYTLSDIAIITRAGVAKILGLSNRGHLNLGACADVVVYEPNDNQEMMFSRPLYVFKNGQLIVERGKVIAFPETGTFCSHVEYDPLIERRLAPYWLDFYGAPMESFKISEAELSGDGSRRIYRVCH